MHLYNILMYHDIRDLKYTKFKNRYLMRSFLRRNTFEDHLKKIKKEFNVISLEELKFLFKYNSKISKPIAVLTFDDGLIDHYNVAELLLNYELPGAFFIPTKCLKQNFVIHTHKIQFILNSNNHQAIIKDIFKYAKWNQVEQNSVWEQYSQSRWKNNWWTKEYVFITNFLRKFPSPIKYSICNYLFEKYVKCSEEELSKDLYMNLKQVKELKSNGFTIGGHGHSSLEFSELTNHEQQVEIKNNYQFLKSINENIKTISYPNGSYNENSLMLLGKNKFDLAFITNDVGFNSLKNINPLLINRIDASQNDLLKLSK